MPIPFNWMQNHWIVSNDSKWRCSMPSIEAAERTNDRKRLNNQSKEVNKKNQSSTAVKWSTGLYEITVTVLTYEPMKVPKFQVSSTRWIKWSVTRFDEIQATKNTEYVHCTYSTPRFPRWEVHWCQFYTAEVNSVHADALADHQYDAFFVVHNHRMMSLCLFFVILLLQLFVWFLIAQ